jgi:hypothetical protein
LAVIPPLMIFLVMSAFSLPLVLTRMDDGDRGIRIIEGNEKKLIWAPEGPGWNWKQDYGGYPSWNMIALYGLDPVGFDQKPGYDFKKGEFASETEMLKYNLCLYLNDEGTSLETEVQNIWRMPTIRDYASAFARHGINAGCVWQGEGFDQMTCDIQPDKETPLWAPDLEPIYYWAAEEAETQYGYFVSYNGWVSKTNKNGGNPRHSYRCVRNP